MALLQSLRIDIIHTLDQFVKQIPVERCACVGTRFHSGSYGGSLTQLEIGRQHTQLQQVEAVNLIDELEFVFMNGPTKVLPKVRLVAANKPRRDHARELLGRPFA